jgi:hypothetical protein
MNTKTEGPKHSSDSQTVRDEIRAIIIEERTNALEAMQWLLSNSQGFKNAVVSFITAKESIEAIDRSGLSGLSQYLKTAP